MSGPADLARLSATIDTANELLLSDQIKMMDVGGGVMRPTNAKAIADLAVQMFGAMIYTSSAQGLAGTVDGSYFSVIAAGTEEYLILYRNTAGSAVEVKRYPSAAAIAALMALISATDDTNVAHSFEDGGNFPLVKILKNGNLELLQAIIANSGGNGIEVADENGFITARIGHTTSNINGFTTVFSDQPGIEFVDDFGFIVGRISATGSFFGDVKDSVVIPHAPAILDQQQRTDLIHVVGYGQSLSAGSRAVPAISLTQPYLNVMQMAGVRCRANEDRYIASGFTPLVEADNSTSSQGETPLSGMVNGVTRRAIEAGELADNWRFIASALGAGGTTVAQLSPRPLGTSGYFESVVQVIKDCKATCDTLEKSYSVWAYEWAQGESNYAAGNNATSETVYTQLMLEIFDNLTHQITQITGQQNQPYIFSYQVAAHRHYGSDTMQLATAQWKASRKRPDFVLATPCYIFETGPDFLHLTNEASWLMGEYKSRAMYWTMINRAEKWRPLEPVSVNWTDTEIVIKFHVPCGQLVIDNALAATTPNGGFDLRSGSVIATNITSVTASGDIVTIALSSPAPTDALLSYGRGRAGDPAQSGPRNGPRGNLRDTHGDFDEVVSPSGTSHKLHNACVMFQHSRKTGFN